MTMSRGSIDSGQLPGSVAGWIAVVIRARADLIICRNRCPRDINAAENAQCGVVRPRRHRQNEAGSPRECHDEREKDDTTRMSQCAKTPARLRRGPISLDVR